MKYVALVTFLILVPNLCVASNSWGDRTQEFHPNSPVLPLAKATPVSDTNACKIEPDNGEFYSEKQQQTLASIAKRESDKPEQPCFRDATITTKYSPQMGNNIR